MVDGLFDDPTDADRLVLVQEHSLTVRGQTCLRLQGCDPLGCGDFSSQGEGEQTCY
jgi:hypothetical protein